MTHIDTSTKAVEALLKDVTEGPWKAEYLKYVRGYRTTIYPVDDPMNSIATVHWHSVKTATGVKTDRAEIATFIAASRELVPALLAERDQLRDELYAAYAIIAAERAEVINLRDALMAIERGDDSLDGMQGDIARAALNQNGKSDDQ